MENLIEIIENQFDEQLVISAEELISSNKIGAISKMENNLWLVQFPNENIEVEILRKPNSKFGYTCDCNYFKDNKACIHVVAALLQLRRERSKNEKKKQKLRKAEAFKKKYSLNTILDQTEKIDLQNFIKSYAKRDKNFALAFKVHFASKTETGSEALKYKGLLDEAVRPKTAKHPNLTRREYFSFRALLDDFLSQMQDNVSQGKLQDAFLIFEKCSDKIAYVKNIYLKNTDKEILKLEEKFIQEFKALLSKDKAPELDIVIVSRLSEIASYSYYFPEQLNYISVINSSMKLSESTKSSLVDNFIDKNKKNELHLHLLLSVMLELAINEQELEALIYSEFSIIQVLDALLLLQNASEYIKVDYYLNQNPIQNCGLIEKDYLRLGQLSASSNTDEFLTLALSIIDSKNENRLSNLIKKNVTTIKFKANFKKYQTLLQQLEPSTSANLYAHFEMFDQLLTVLETEKDLGLLMNFDTFLMNKKYEGPLFMLYKDLLKNYLDKHIGIPSRTVVQNVFLHLSRANASALRVKLNKFIINEYPHRYHGKLNTFSL